MCTPAALLGVRALAGLVLSGAFVARLAGCTGQEDQKHQGFRRHPWSTSYRGVGAYVRP
jgi:hypothetical protein